MNVAKGAFAAGVTRVGVPFEPAALVLWWTRQTEEGVARGCSGGIGFWASGTARAAAWASEDGVTPSRATRYADEVAIVGIDAEGPTLRGHIVAADSSGFDIEWVGAGPWTVHYLALGGIAAAQVGWLSDAVETGFAPDLVLVSPVSVTEPRSVERGLAAGIGAASPAGQAGSAYAARDGAATAEVGGAQRDAAVVIAASPTEVRSLGRIDLGPLGFSVAWEGSPPGTLNPYLAVAGVRCVVGTAVSPRKPGRGRTRGLPFRPEALLVFSFGLSPRSAPAEIGRLCVGAATPDAQGCAGWDDRNVPGPTTATHVCSSTEHVLLVTDTQTGSLHAAARMGSLDRRGFTLDWAASDGHERQLVYVALAGKGL